MGEITESQKEIEAMSIREAEPSYTRQQYIIRARRPHLYTDAGYSNVQNAFRIHIAQHNIRSGHYSSS